MRRRTLLFALALLGTGTLADLSAEEKKRAIRMKSTPKLKEILSDLGIAHGATMSKEELRELVLQKDALTKWEKKHPGQKKAPSKARAAPGAGAGGMGEMFFTMMDKNKDGHLSKQEVAGLNEMMSSTAGGAGPGGSAGGAPPAMSSEQADQFFAMMDSDGDGIASKAEVSAFMSQMMGMMGKSMPSF